MEKDDAIFAIFTPNIWLVNTELKMTGDFK